MLALLDNERIWPILNILEFKLFILFNSSTGILNLLDIEYSVSPTFTSYVSVLLSSYPICSKIPLTVALAKSFCLLFNILISLGLSIKPYSTIMDSKGDVFLKI